MRKDVAILGGLGAAAALVIAWLIVRSPHGSRSALEAVPADAFLVANADVWALAESPVGAALVGDGGTRASSLLGLGMVESTCGFNPLMHLRTIALAVPEKGEHGDFGVAATGDLARDALERCATDLIARRGGKAKTRTEGSFTVVSDATSSEGGEVAFRDGGPFLVGRGVWLDRMIDAVEGRTATVATSAAHAALRDDLKTRDLDADAFVLSAIVPRDLRDRIKDEMALETPDGGTLGAKMEGVLAVSAAGLALHAGRGATDDVRLVAELRCDDDKACGEVETLILHQRLLWSGNLALRLGGLGPLIDNLETQRPEPRVLVVRTRAPAADVADLVDRFANRPLPPRPPGGVPPHPDAPRPDLQIQAPGSSDAATRDAR